MKNKENKIPAVNQRIKQLINERYNGNVRSFCMEIGYNDSQKVNRLFHLDPRNGRYPNVSMTILNDISNKLDISLIWLQKGEGEMEIILSPQNTLNRPTSNEYNELRQRYEELNSEYIALSRELRESNKEIRELRRQLDEARAAKEAAEARITQLELRLAVQKKSYRTPLRPIWRYSCGVALQ